MGFIVLSHMTDIYRVGECHAVVKWADTQQGEGRYVMVLVTASQ